MSAPLSAPVGVRPFLEAHGFGPAAFVEPLGGGGRHLVHAVTQGERKAVLKVYEAAAGGRDAFARELAVHDLLARFVPESVPSLLGSDASLRCALFGWVDGRRPAPDELGPDAPRKMALFAAALNRPDVRRAARESRLPDASDAAFRFADHRSVAEARIIKLREARPSGPLGDDLEAFLAGDLQPALGAADWISGDDPELPEGDRVLSASDFGFHNVIERADGAFCFFDFEHAGWDDPAKMAADFFLQPECQLGEAAAESFLQELEASGCFPRGLRRRVAALLPVQAVKWTTIVLNVFHRPGQNAEMLAARLEKARRYWRGAGRALALAGSRG